jgi:adenylosuccinate synthase
MDGWDGSIAGIRDFDKLPKEAKDYVKRIEELIDSKIILISTSPERADTIYLENPFDKS